MTANLDDLEQVVDAAMWPGTLQMAGDLYVSDCRSRLIDIPVIDLAVNQDLVDVSFERVYDMSLSV